MDYAHDRPVHGTYPRDFGANRIVRTLTVDEAAQLLNLKPDARGDLIINKGFVILGMSLPRDYSLDMRETVRGKQAVYNHDGNYRLIEWGL